jgi:hypothetical protein
VLIAALPLPNSGVGVHGNRFFFTTNPSPSGVSLPENQPSEWLDFLNAAQLQPTSPDLLAQIWARG